MARALILFGFAVGAGGGLGTLVLLQQRRDVDAEAYGSLWAGPIGRALFRLARLITPRRLLASSSTHRPTELSIGMAAEQLYESLPKETRQDLGDLPEVIHRLERDAQAQRKRWEALAEAAARTGGPAEDRGEEEDGTSTAMMASRRDEALAAVREERDAVQARLKKTVAALEAVRLSLLRLHAGSTTVENITTDLVVAFEAAKEVEVLVDARREVDAALRKADEP